MIEPAKKHLKRLWSCSGLIILLINFFFFFFFNYKVKKKERKNISGNFDSERRHFESFDIGIKSVDRIFDVFNVFFLYGRVRRTDAPHEDNKTLSTVHTALFIVKISNFPNYWIIIGRSNVSHMQLKNVCQI